MGGWARGCRAPRSPAVRHVRSKLPCMERSLQDHARLRRQYRTFCVLWCRVGLEEPFRRGFLGQCQQFLLRQLRLRARASDRSGSPRSHSWACWFPRGSPKSGAVNWIWRWYVALWTCTASVWCAWSELRFEAVSRCAVSQLSCRRRSRPSRSGERPGVFRLAGVRQSCPRQRPRRRNSRSGTWRARSSISRCSRIRAGSAVSENDRSWTTCRN